MDLLLGVGQGQVGTPAANHRTTCFSFSCSSTFPLHSTLKVQGRIRLVPGGADSSAQRAAGPAGCCRRCPQQAGGGCWQDGAPRRGAWWRQAVGRCWSIPGPDCAQAAPAAARCAPRAGPLARPRRLHNAAALCAWPLPHRHAMCVHDNSVNVVTTGRRRWRAGFRIGVKNLAARAAGALRGVARGCGAQRGRGEGALRGGTCTPGPLGSSRRAACFCAHRPARSCCVRDQCGAVQPWSGLRLTRGMNSKARHATMTLALRLRVSLSAPSRPPPHKLLAATPSLRNFAATPPPLLARASVVQRRSPGAPQLEPPRFSRTRGAALAVNAEKAARQAVAQPRGEAHPDHTRPASA